MAGSNGAVLAEPHRQRSGRGNPDPKASEALLGIHVDQFINNDHGVVKGGEGFYDKFYIRDGAYEVHAVRGSGFSRYGSGAWRRTLRPSGRTGDSRRKGPAGRERPGHLDAVAVLSDHGGPPWLDRPTRRWPCGRTGPWARRQAPAESPFAGVLPNALADGEYLWDGKFHIVGYDFWNLRGMFCTAAAAREQVESRCRAIHKGGRAYQAAIDVAWKRTGLPHFPPSWKRRGRTGATRRRCGRRPCSPRRPARHGAGP